jgi:hypothetical protein
MEKNHNHAELPQEDHTDDYTEEETVSAIEFYVGEDRLKELPVATPGDLKHAWGAVDQELLDVMKLVALNTTDKAALEALEEKQKKKQEREIEREAVKENKPSKNRGADLAKIQKKKQKDKAAKQKGNGGFGQTQTPPPNQLQTDMNVDNDETPKDCTKCSRKADDGLSESDSSMDFE